MIENRQQSVKVDLDGQEASPSMCLVKAALEKVEFACEAMESRLEELVLD